MNQPTAPPETIGTLRPEAKKSASALFNFWFDVALAASVAFLIWVSATMRVAFPAPTLADGWTLWGWTYNQWHNAQFISMCVSLVLALEHVVLHWNWVCGVVSSKILKLKKRPDDAVQRMYGIAVFFGLAFMVFILMAVAMFTVKPPAPPG